MTRHYFIRRLLYSFPILFGVTLICFILFNIIGADPALQLAGKYATPEQIQILRQELGLDKSLPEQYFRFIKQVASFDWGQSWQTRENINTMLWRGLSPSLSLTLPAYFLGLLLSVVLALLTTKFRKERPWADRFVTTTCLFLLSTSFLVYVIGFQYFFAFKWGLFSINGWDPSWSGRWHYLLLPWLIFIVASIAPNILIFRSTFFQEANKNYVRTARAKGVSEVQLFSQHILRNALSPVLTIAFVQIPFLMMGSLLLEHFFGIPGLGGTLIQAIQNADQPVIKAITVMGAITYLVFNLIADVLLSWLDPRVELK